MKILSQATVSALVGFVLAAIIIGCGGGGGGSSTGGGGGGGGGGTTSGTPAAGQYLEVTTFQGTKVDPLNLTVGQNLKLFFVNYDTVGNRTVLSGTFSLSGSGASAFSLTGNVINVQANTATLATISGTATVSGVPKILKQDVGTVPSGAKGVVTGRLMSSNGTTPVGNVQVEFYDALGNFKGGAVSKPDGRFTANVATSMKSLTLKGSTIPDAYYKQMKYLGKDYPVAGLSCPLVLPTLNSGQTFALPANITLPRQLDGPPPPPSGCN